MSFSVCLRSSRFFRLGSSLFVVLLILSLFRSLSPQEAFAQEFTDTAIQNLWLKTDGPVATGASVESWIWGPVPLNSRTELYQQSPGGQRLVQYFDKGRLEVNNLAAPAGNPVSIGLLSSELVTGRVQVGDHQYEDRTPAMIPVAGDVDSQDGPTYATFSKITSLNGGAKAEVKKGPVKDYINRSGEISQGSNYPAVVNYGSYQEVPGRNLPDIFYNWLQGLSGRGYDWQYLMGQPITEPYWATFKVAGKEHQILIQLFERRTLTFDPLNPAEWQIEMGNIGLHYWMWRYNTGISAVSTPQGWDSEEISFLDLINVYRKGHNLPLLAPSAKLTKIARFMSQDMADKGYFGHTDSLGRDPFRRMSELGYPASTWRGENLAGGFGQAAGVIVAWENSPEHNLNMLGQKYHAIGISRIYNPNSLYHWYWSTEFGSE